MGQKVHCNRFLQKGIPGIFLVLEHLLDDRLVPDLTASCGGNTVGHKPFAYGLYAFAGQVFGKYPPNNNCFPFINNKFTVLVLVIAGKMRVIDPDLFLYEFLHRGKVEFIVIFVTLSLLNCILSNSRPNPPVILLDFDVLLRFHHSGKRGCTTWHMAITVAPHLVRLIERPDRSLTPWPFFTLILEELL